MDVYDGLLDAIQTEYDLVRQLKKSERGSVRVVRHRQSGVRFVFRRYEGSPDSVIRDRAFADRLRIEPAQ